MRLAIENLLKSSLLLGLIIVGVCACGQSNGGGNGTGGRLAGGAGGTGDGGRSGSGGATSAGGTTASGGTKGSGGVNETGGTVGAGGTNTGGTKAGGSTASGGAATGGSSSSSADAGGSSGSSTATGGATDGGPAGGGSGGTGGTGGTSSGACQKGQAKPSELVFMGESFYAIDPQYNEKRVEGDAQAAGSLAAGAKYRNVAVSGQPMSYIAATEWDEATKGGTVKSVIMDGGGIDCLTSSSCPACADEFTTLLGKMATEGVQDVIYTRYPEPGNPPGSNAALKTCLDTTMPKMQTVCAGSTTPRCHWLDLRPVWVDGDTADGLHPTQSGGNHVGDAIWAEMVKDCIAQ